MTGANGGSSPDCRKDGGILRRSKLIRGQARFRFRALRSNMTPCARALGAEGFEVLSAENGFAALAVLDVRLVDIVVSDVSMPEMNGIELLKEIRRRRVPVQVVLLTGSATEETRAGAREYGAFRCLLKPVGSIELRKAVRDAIAEVFVPA